MTIKQRILMRKVASAEGVSVADFGPIDKRTLSSLFYREWIFIQREKLKLTLEGAVQLNHANHVGIFLKNETPFHMKKKYSKVIGMPA